jgi:predicted PurR-regulated permease PerM
VSDGQAAVWSAQWLGHAAIVRPTTSTCAGPNVTNACDRYARRVSTEPEASSSLPPADVTGEPSVGERRLPRWVVPAVVVFWGGFLGAVAVRFVWGKLSGLFVLLAIAAFLALAIEPGVNRLARRGWRRGRATALILFGVMAAFLVFVGAIGTLVGSQIADLLQDSETYIADTVDVLNDTFGTNLDAQELIDDFNDPDGAIQQFIRDQQDNAVRLSVAALGGLLQLLSVLLFTFYLVSDGPKLRRAICSRLTPARQERVLAAWELAGTKTGGYLYSRALLALLSTIFHWIVFQSLGTAAPLALALWVGVVSQFLPVVGTYLAGVLPVLLAFLDSPLKALIVLGAIVVYQQIENYLFSPRITAHTMELHPALAFGAALAGASVLGAVGAVLALPAAAMCQAIVSEWGDRHQVIQSELTKVHHPRDA